MTDGCGKSPMLDLFVFESLQLLEQLERLILDGEKTGGLETAIHEVFRIMHTVKGSSAMMLFDNISSLAHALEDVFYYLRESKPQNVDYCSLTDMVLHAVDFMKGEITQVENGQNPEGDSSGLIKEIGMFLTALKNGSPAFDCNAAGPSAAQHEQRYYISPCIAKDEGLKNFEARVFFDEACEMENVRAYMLINELKEESHDLHYYPDNVLEDDTTAEIIRQEGFKVNFSTGESQERIQACFERTMFMKSFELYEVQVEATPVAAPKPKAIDLDGPLPHSQFPDCAAAPETDRHDSAAGLKQQRFISVKVDKMDLLMDLVGELVVAEAMVTQNPELKGLDLDSFYKAARQLQKIINELQDVVMSVRMVPLTATFQKMSRVVRDMTKKLGKQVKLETIGGETEVDKNIIEHISDPLMHLIRNALDHGIEAAEERTSQGKDACGKIRLEARNAGGDVWITVQDDGGGLNKEKILHKALERGLVQKTETTLTDKEIYSFIFRPGFSTKEAVTEFSGRGVGMDVVTRNIEKIGGSISVDSQLGQGTTISVRIPLTLAIIDGMNVKVGKAIYTVPIIAVKEAFSLQEHNVISDTDGREMILLRGQCYPVVRLYERYSIKGAVTNLCEGVLLMLETEGKGVCLFVDALLGQQQVVVKAIPKYIKKTKGISGCTFLGDGSVSLIIDVAGLVEE